MQILLEKIDIMLKNTDKDSKKYYLLSELSKDITNIINENKECRSWKNEITLSNGQTWSCMNLWATSVWDWVSEVNDCNRDTKNCNSWLTWLWNFYQWWRNDAVTWEMIYSTYTWILVDWYVWNNNMYWLDIKTLNWDWYVNDSSLTNPTRWSWNSNRWPCKSWRHVPTQSEWKSACDIISWTNCKNNSDTIKAIQNTLKLPFTGYRESIIWSYVVDWGTSYWTSTPNTELSGGSYVSAVFYMDNNYFWSGNPWIDVSSKYLIRTNWYPIRCIKN